MERKKITVKHYLNTRAKEKIYNNEAFYPLYVQIIVKGKKAQIKSKINEFLKIYRSDIDRITNGDARFKELITLGYFSENRLLAFNKAKLFPIYHLLKDEQNFITKVISFSNPFVDKHFTLNNFSREYEKHIAEISNIFDDRIKTWYKNELKAIFLKAIDQEDNRQVFRISNYLIHFINWDNSFFNFYESTYEVMPSELKIVENLLDNELRTAIKAYLAFHTKVNVLKRFFEKRELGKISTLSYLDWQTDIKTFILNEFEKLFGQQKALEYILSLDSILQNEFSR
jgi:hypothetical protein